MRIGPRKHQGAGKGRKVERVEGPPPHEVACAECGTLMILLRQLSAETGETTALFYACPRFPKCYCTHSAHRDGRPMGKPADAVTRAARHRAHEIFDELWRPPGGWWTRGAAYAWLAEQFGGEVHMGSMSLEQAERVQVIAAAKVAELRLERREMNRRRSSEGKQKKRGKARFEDRKHRAERHDRKLERQLEASLRHVQGGSEPPPEPEEEPPRLLAQWRATLKQARWRASYALRRVWERGYMKEREALQWLAAQTKGKRIERMTMKECELVETRVERLIAGFRMERRLRRAAELKQQAEDERRARLFEPGWDREGAAMLQASQEDERVFSLAEGVRFVDEEDSELSFVETERRARLDLMAGSGFGADWWVNGNRRRKERQEHG